MNMGGTFHFKDRIFAVLRCDDDYQWPPVGSKHGIPMAVGSHLHQNESTKRLGSRNRIGRWYIHQSFKHDLDTWRVFFHGKMQLKIDALGETFHDFGNRYNTVLQVLATGGGDQQNWR